MQTALRSLVLLTTLGLAACTIETVNTAPPATPAAPAPAAAAPAAPATAPAAPTHSTQTERGGLLVLHPTPTTAETAAAPPPPPAADPNSLEPCCAALRAVKDSGRGADAKTKSAQAAQVCPAIATLVKNGKTPKAAGLAQIKSSLTGVDVPAECQ